MNDEQIVETVMNKIETFYFEDGEESGEAIFNAFAAKHQELFLEECDAEGMENKLAYTDVYKDFCMTFEAHIEKVIGMCGVSVDQFFNALKSMQEKDADNSFYVEVLLSVCDYTNFIDMMKHYKAEHCKKE